MARPLRPPLVLADVIYFIVCLPQTASAFFFSSRRRHTILNCDWSSDVCSSDLLRADPLPPGESPWNFLATANRDPSTRSEERRVGKECRTRWTTENEKKKKK